MVPKKDMGCKKKGRGGPPSEKGERKIEGTKKKKQQETIGCTELTANNPQNKGRGPKSPKKTHARVEKGSGWGKG